MRQVSSESLKKQLADQSPEAAAEFLMQNRLQLDAKEVGEWLGAKKNEEALKHFVGQFTFEGKSFDGALREFLREFKLPGEAQQIDQLMNCFAEAYYNQNPSLQQGPANSESFFILAFATIMLNTDLHNPSMKNHISLDTFKYNLAGTEAKDKFSDEFLKELYDEVKAKEFKFHEKTGPPSIQIGGTAASKFSFQHDQTYLALKGFLSDPSVEGGLKDVFPGVEGIENLKIDTEGLSLNPQSSLPISGYSGTFTLEDPETGAKCSVTVKRPDIASRTFGGVSGVTIEPVGGDENSLKLAAQIAGSFKTEPEIKTPYRNEMDIMQKEIQAAQMEAAKQKNRPRSNAISGPVMR